MLVNMRSDLTSLRIELASRLCELQSKMGSCIVKYPIRVESSTQTDLTVPSPPDGEWMVQKRYPAEQEYTAYAYRKIVSKSGVTRCLPYDASPMDVFHATNDYESSGYDG